MKTGRPYAYPWEEWADGKLRTITRGKDFTVSPRDMKTHLMRHARRTGCYVHSQIKGESVLFRFVARAWWEED